MSKIIDGIVYNYNIGEIDENHIEEIGNGYAYDHYNNTYLKDAKPIPERFEQQNYIVTISIITDEGEKKIAKRCDNYMQATSFVEIFTKRCLSENYKNKTLACIPFSVNIQGEPKDFDPKNIQEIINKVGEDHCSNMDEEDVWKGSPNEWFKKLEG